MWFNYHFETIKSDHWFKFDSIAKQSKRPKSNEKKYGQPNWIALICYQLQFVTHDQLEILCYYLKKNERGKKKQQMNKQTNQIMNFTIEIRAIRKEESERSWVKTTNRSTFFACVQLCLFVCWFVSMLVWMRLRFRMYLLCACVYEHVYAHWTVKISNENQFSS